VCVLHGRCTEDIINKSPNRYILIVILQQNTDTIKVENDMDIVTDEDSFGIKFDEVYLPSAFSVEKAESEVRLFSCGFVIVGTCIYFLWVILMCLLIQ
jgi:hypothetical protein